MTGRPEAGVTPPNCLIRAAVPSDLPMISDLEQRCFSDPWHPESLARDLSGKTPAHYTVVVRHDRIIAFASWWNMVDAAEITRIAVLPDDRGGGIASALLKRLIDDVREQALPEIRLEMRRGNRAARALYEKAGFEAVAVRTGYYTNPDEDAIIMLKKLAE
ncbi:MAG: ribosomal protein S18-alanine N-acetyltransferase [Eubacteriales bacterium]|nr:ribosomal protein S18-alanine N-acetyltransferase [Eubacteriales bacterium]MDD3866471.1 ribosomal protein S18-alanine N-acetyltransferase [Eubacteriales bacterium]MDD4460963.1 ribosomal protein S18-alanine N-acetyltransferase [Eubacteriales bacterium]